MRTMRFSNLFLLSMRERRGLRLHFSPDITMLRAPNGFGKSAAVKSLYETFGASPHKVDATWRSANVVSYVEFSIDDAEYSILRSGDRFTIFDHAGTVLRDTSAITSELSPFLADLFDFRLVMTNREKQTVIPPPAYIFAPYYVDQDGGWASPWQSFEKMYLPRSKEALSDYHMGLRSNEYYNALARRDREQAAVAELETQRAAVTRAMAEVRELVSKSILTLSLDDFSTDVDALVSESAELSRLQRDYRDRLAGAENERSLWSEQQDILRQTMSELRDTVHLAARQPDSVECPTCGQHYDNSLAEQFGLVANFDDLFEAYQAGRERVAELDQAIQKHRSSLARVEAKLAEVEGVLSRSKEDTTLEDVISAQGRTETTRALRGRLSRVDEALGTALTNLKGAQGDLRRASNPARTEKITAFFNSKFIEFAGKLDVRTDFSSSRISSMRLARGSEGPRGLICYYYAILHTAREFGSSTFCPIVVDAPNQQGQDATHLPEILRFLVEQRPRNSQVIIASEDTVEMPASAAQVTPVGVSKNQVLRDDAYEEVAARLRPLLGHLL